MRSVSEINFVAVDWGTTSFRLWALGNDNEVVAATEGPFGMSQLRRSDFGRVLEESLTKLEIDANVPVIICGMAGAAQGWSEAPYLTAPTKLGALGDEAVKVRGIQRDVWILPGVKQVTPANVMRGEESQLAGLIHFRPDFNGVACLPGTHSKWVRVTDGEIRTFETCMTGELFAFLSTKSVLSHSMLMDGWSNETFLEAVKGACDAPENVPCRLFSIRAEMLVGDQSSGEARARLSGLLIGQELAATRRYWSGGAIVLMGAKQLCSLYADALSALGAETDVLDNDAMTVAGLASAFQRKDAFFDA